MEGIAEILWKLAYDLCTHEQVEQKRRFTAPVRSVASGEHYSHKSRGDLPGQHIGKGSSRRDRRFKKRGKQAIGRSRGGLTTKIHMVTATDRSAVSFALSGGEAHDSPEGTALLDKIIRVPEQKYILMDKAYEGESMRKKAMEKGYSPAVPPKSNRKDPWEYDKERYKQRSEIERYFLRLKRFRKIFARYDKLDVLFCGFIYFAMIVDAI